MRNGQIQVHASSLTSELRFPHPQKMDSNSHSEKGLGLQTWSWKPWRNQSEDWLALLGNPLPSPQPLALTLQPHQLIVALLTQLELPAVLPQQLLVVVIDLLDGLANLQGQEELLEQVPTSTQACSLDPNPGTGGSACLSPQKSSTLQRTEVSPCWVWRMESGPRPHFPAQATEWAAPTSQLHPKATGPIFLKFQHSYSTRLTGQGKRARKAPLCWAVHCACRDISRLRTLGEKWQGQLPLGAACVGQGRVSSLSFCCLSHLYLLPTLWY